ncbi:hypothetical protein ACROYT_G043481 [Oculina patagonica]
MESGIQSLKSGNHGGESDLYYPPIQDSLGFLYIVRHKDQKRRVVKTLQLVCLRPYLIQLILIFASVYKCFEDVIVNWSRSAGYAVPDQVITVIGARSIRRRNRKTSCNTDMKYSLLLVCLLTICVIALVSARDDDQYYEPDVFRKWVLSRRGCKEKGEECSSSSECCNTGCPSDFNGVKYQCQICSFDGHRRTCYY